MAKWLFWTAALGCVWLVGCQMGGDGSEVADVKEIAEVSYVSSSGTILPELQWYEETVISKKQTMFTRSGQVNETAVNAGTWEFAVDEAAVAALFTQLAAVACEAIQRIEPDDPPDGGDSTSYTISYADGTTCTLWYEPGVIYTDGDLIVAPVQAFIQQLVLPAEAANRYQE